MIIIYQKHSSNVKQVKYLKLILYSDYYLKRSNDLVYSSDAAGYSSEI